MLSRIIALCITTAGLISSPLSVPELQHYTFTATESKTLPGTTTDTNRNGIGSEQDRIGRLALVAFKYQAGNRQNHNDFPIEVGHVRVAGQDQRFDAFRLSEPLRKTIKTLNTQHTILYRFPHKSDWVLYRTDSGFVTQVATIKENEIIPDQYTRVLRISSDRLNGTGTYFFAPATVSVSSYPQLSSRVEAARLADTKLGRLSVYRHAVSGTPPDPLRATATLTRQFFIIKGASGPGIIWQDKENHAIILTNFSADLSSSTNITLGITRPGRLFAACADPEGNLYYLLARSKDDPDILELAKTAPNGKLLARITPDTSKSGLNIFSMGAEAAELAWSNGRLCMMLMRTMHKSADGLNHQGGIAVLFDASTLKQIRNLGQTSGHSFDNVLSLNSAGEFIGIDLGDNYPRGIHLHKLSDKNKVSRVVYTFKTLHGTKEQSPAGASYPPYPEISRPGKTYYKWSNDNRTYTELGGIIETPQGYMVVFAGEPSPEGKVLDNSRLSAKNADMRNIGLVGVVKDFNKAPSRGSVVSDELLFTRSPPESGGFFSFGGVWSEQRTAGVIWLTRYTAEEGISARHIKTASLPDGSLLVLWETVQLGKHHANWAMTVNAAGTPLVEPFKLPEQLNLNRRDAIMVDGKRVYIASGSGVDKRVELFVLQLN